MRNWLYLMMISHSTMELSRHGPVAKAQSISHDYSVAWLPNLNSHWIPHGRSFPKKHAMPFCTVGILKFMLNIRTVTVGFAIIQLALKGLLLSSSGVTLKPIVIFREINMRPICAKRHVRFVKAHG